MERGRPRRTSDIVRAKRNLPLVFTSEEADELRPVGNDLVKRENIALDYIRKNVKLERIQEVEEALSDWSTPHIEKYFDEILMESVYRSHKGSHKIEISKSRGEMYLGFILYVLFGEPKIDTKHYISSKEINKTKTVLKKRFEKDSYFLRYCKEFLDTKTGNKDEKMGWINIEPYVYLILGGEIFFYCTLKALIEVSKKALTNKRYNYLPLMNWKEGVVEYLVYEAIERKKILKY